ncbi:tellurite resistance domain protein [Enterobacteriaceae bacterium ESL0689]|nr:tellurite resistance domain protein [Enterobacteriaceae bacterium ESL0689]
MQRLSRAAHIDEATLATYQGTLAIIQRYLPPPLAFLYATVRRSSAGELEWWTARQGLARSLAELSQEEQAALQNKRQQYQTVIADLIDKLDGIGEDKSAAALRTLLNHSQGLDCFDVAGEPVLINWSPLSEETPFVRPVKPTTEPVTPAIAPETAMAATPAVAPTSRWKRWLALLLLLLLLLLLALAGWLYYLRHNTPVAAGPSEPNIDMPVIPALPKIDVPETLPLDEAGVIPPVPEVTKPVEPPEPEVVAPVAPPEPVAEPAPKPEPKPEPKPKPYIELTKDNPEVKIAKRDNFDFIKVNLKWKQGKKKEGVDLDVGAIVRLKNGKTTEIDALSGWGDYYSPPYVVLPQDLRDGTNRTGEWLYVNGSHWQEIDEIMVHSLVYSGSESWKGTGATVTIYIPGEKPITTTLVGNSKDSISAAIAKLKNVNGSLVVQRLGRTFPDRRSMSDYYGYGLPWVAAEKD